jgi:hypothetical protein
LYLGKKRKWLMVLFCVPLIQMAAGLGIICYDRLCSKANVVCLEFALPLKKGGLDFFSLESGGYPFEYS